MHRTGRSERRAATMAAPSAARSTPGLPRTRPIRVGTLTLACALLLTPAEPAWATVTYDTIALSGATGTALGLGPDQGAGVHFSGFGVPTVNTAGQVAFSGLLTGPGVGSSNNAGIWTTVGGTPAVLAREGTDGPAGPGLGAGVHFSVSAIFAPQVLNSTGEAAFIGTVTGGGVDGTNFRGIWTTAGGTLAAVARTGTDGQLGPGMDPGVHFSTLIDRVFNAAGNVAFQGELTGTDVDTTNRRGIWINAGGSLAVVARTGSDGPGPNLGAGVNFTAFSGPTLNAAGQVAFYGELTGDGVDGTNHRGIWTNAGGSLAVVARTGSDGPGPGLGAGVHFNELGPPVLNSTGAVAFTGGLGLGAGVDSTNNRGIWTTTGGSLAAVARKGTDGDTGPGQGAGVQFNFFKSPVLNSAGEIAFHATLMGEGVDLTNNEGIWTTTGGTLAPVAREGTDGNLGPGLGTGVVFGTGAFPFGDSFFTPTINGAGEVAFAGIVTGTGVDSTNDRGLWASTGGTLQLIVREGDLFDVDPGAGVDLRTISLIGFSGDVGGEDGRSLSLNDNGLLAFELRFTDGSSGIFTALVPEPASVALLGLAAPLLCFRGRGRGRGHS